MKRLLCIDGRLPWPLVAAIVYLTLSAVVVDFVWRVYVVQFETLLLSAVAIDATVAIALIVLYYVFRRRLRSQA